jgi:anti-sigma factor RsiW
MTDHFDPPAEQPPSLPTTAHVEAEELSAFVDSELGADRVAVVLEHLASCEACERDRTALSEMRLLVGLLPTTVPASARASAVAAALTAIGTDRRASSVVTMQRHLRRYRAVAIAASIVLASGVAGGIDLMHDRLAPSSSLSAGRPARSQEGVSAGGTSATSPAPTIEFRALDRSNALGPVLDVLGPGAATQVRLLAGKGGRFTALVELAPGHAVPAALQSGRGAVVLALPAGTRLGLLEKAGGGTIEINELTARAALEVQRFLR